MTGPKCQPRSAASDGRKPQGARTRARDTSVQNTSGPKAAVARLAQTFTCVPQCAPVHLSCDSQCVTHSSDRAGHHSLPPSRMAQRLPGLAMLRVASEGCGPAQCLIWPSLEKKGWWVGQGGYHAGEQVTGRKDFLVLRGWHHSSVMKDLLADATSQVQLLG